MHHPRPTLRCGASMVHGLAPQRSVGRGQNSDDVNPAIINIEFKAYPNPFNPTVQFDVKTDKKYEVLEIQVFNVKGQLVKTLEVSTEHNHKEHTLSWDGSNNKGHNVSSGVYLCKLTTRHLVLSSVKVSLIK